MRFPSCNPKTLGATKKHIKILKAAIKTLTQGTANFFEGLDGLDQRFVPFNGGFGTKQISWLEGVLNEAKKRK